jgi:hypothetical protein
VRNASSLQVLKINTLMLARWHSMLSFLIVLDVVLNYLNVKPFVYMQKYEKKKTAALIFFCLCIYINYVSLVFTIYYRGVAMLLRS